MRREEGLAKSRYVFTGEEQRNWSATASLSSHIHQMQYRDHARDSTKESIRELVPTRPPSRFCRSSTKRAVLDSCGVLLKCSGAREILHEYLGTAYCYH